MNDMTKAAEPKSDQQNAEDYLGGVTKTIKITKVTIKSGDQPVTINFEGDNGKPYKPCKTMCKVMVSIWGADANKYIGKSMTLYGDPTVTWGGMAVGGIRISHMSDMGAPKTMALAANRASKKLITVNPLVVTADKPKNEPPTASKELCESAYKMLEEIRNATGEDPDAVIAEITKGRMKTQIDMESAKEETVTAIIGKLKAKLEGA